MLGHPEEEHLSCPQVGWRERQPVQEAEPWAFVCHSYLCELGCVPLSLWDLVSPTVDGGINLTITMILLLSHWVETGVQLEESPVAPGDLSHGDPGLPA